MRQQPYVSADCWSVLDQADDLSPLGLVLILSQQASISQLLELPEPCGRVALFVRGSRRRDASRDASQGIELHRFFLRFADRGISVQGDGMGRAVTEDDLPRRPSSWWPVP